MKQYIILLLATFVILLAFVLVTNNFFSNGLALGAPTANYFRDLLPTDDNTYDLGTSTLQWRNIETNNITISGTCTGTGCGSGGGGSVRINGVSSTVFTFATSGASGIAISTSTNTITWLQATSSATSNGFLSSADWTTFSAKAPNYQALWATSSPTFVSTTLNGYLTFGDGSNRNTLVHRLDTFTIELPTSTSGFENFIRLMPESTTTITKVKALNKNPASSWEFNFYIGTDYSAATSTMNRVFTGIQTANSTTTIQSFTPNGSTTVPVGSFLMIQGEVASSTRVFIEVYGY